MDRQPRLRFTAEERSDPMLGKPIRRAEKAAAQADKAQAKLPKKQVRRTVVDPASGKVTTKLVLEERKKPPSKLSHAIRDAPGSAVLGKIHQEVRETEQDNVGVESAHKSEQAAETNTRLVRDGYRTHKLKPYRKAARAERRLERANLHVLYRKSLRDNPQLSSNPISRWQQRRAIRKEYAAAKKARQSRTFAEQAARAARTVEKKSEQAAAFVWRHRRGFLVVLGLLVLIALFLSTMASCTGMMGSGSSMVSSTTYPSEDGEMLEAEAYYAGLEAELQSELDNYEADHSYDEYHFTLDELGHDPYVLISLLSALHPGAWTAAEMEPTMDDLFDRQYILTETVTEETRYDDAGEPYTYTICTVTLDNTDLSHLPVYLMDEDGMGLYAGYMAALGNRPDLFPQGDYPNASVVEDYLDYEVPPEALEDETFAAMLEEAEKYLGYPYVWGGSSPSTSFDCSGYVSWVINHSGWDVGRLGALGLYNICTPVSAANARPGDLVFFENTYDAPLPGPTHVGIYVGGNKMIHCGDPISYADLGTNYWQTHFYSFGRLP